MNDFLDEYKHLEKLCNEIYDQQHGITLYIEEMEQTPRYSCVNISGWTRDLENLKRVRHIRNAMVHDTSYSTSDYQEDPLSLLRLTTMTISEPQTTTIPKQPIKFEPNFDYPTNFVMPQAPKPSNHDNQPDNDDEWSTPKFISVFIIVMTIVAGLAWFLFRTFIPF